MPATRQRKQRTRGKRWQERHGRYKQGSRHRKQEPGRKPEKA